MFVVSAKIKNQRKNLLKKVIKNTIRKEFQKKQRQHFETKLLMFVNTAVRLKLILAHFHRHVILNSSIKLNKRWCLKTILKQV